MGDAGRVGILPGLLRVFASPTSKLIETIGYKRTMVVSLFIQVVGCLLFVPAAKMVSFPLFLTAVFVVGAGVTALQTSANPYVSILGPEDSASIRLNLAQAFNSIGGTIAPLIAGAYILTDPRQAGQQASIADTVRVTLHPHCRRVADSGACGGVLAPAAHCTDAGFPPGKEGDPMSEPQHLELQAHGAWRDGNLLLRGRGSGSGVDCRELLQDSGNEHSQDSLIPGLALLVRRAGGPFARLLDHDQGQAGKLLGIFGFTAAALITISMFTSGQVAIGTPGAVRILQLGHVPQHLYAGYRRVGADDQQGLGTDYDRRGGRSGDSSTLSAHWPIR